MKKFSQKLYPTVREETFFAPCGVADLIATCYGGRNRLVAMEYTRLRMVRQKDQHADSPCFHVDFLC
jgi:glycerol-3-phosphate dehydrogenase (NAD+)